MKKARSWKLEEKGVKGKSKRRLSIVRRTWKRLESEFPVNKNKLAKSSMPYKHVRLFFVPNDDSKGAYTRSI